MLAFVLRAQETSQLTLGFSETHVILSTEEVSTPEDVNVAGAFPMQRQHSPDTWHQYFSGAELLGCWLSTWPSAQVWLGGAISTGQCAALPCGPLSLNLLFPTESPLPILGTDPEPGPASI